MTRETSGLALGLVGVTVFAGTLPFTRLAVEALDPWFLAAGRAAVAGSLAALTLAGLRRRLPDGPTLLVLGLSSFCIVAVFPVFTALAMRRVPAAHGGVVLGILPLATSVLGAWLAGERHGARFWLAAAAGAAVVLAFAVREGAGAIETGDLFLLGAVASSALGYALSGQLARRLPGWEVISWQLVLALPLALPAAIWLMPAAPAEVPAWSWVGFAYVSLMSQYLGFFAWNAGLAMGGIARVSQVQLLQTFITLGIAAVLNGERVGPATWIVAGFIVLLIVVGRSPERRADEAS